MLKAFFNAVNISGSLLRLVFQLHIRTYPNWSNRVETPYVYGVDEQE